MSNAENYLLDVALERLEGVSTSDKTAFKAAIQDIMSNISVKASGSVTVLYSGTINDGSTYGLSTGNIASDE